MSPRNELGAFKISETTDNTEHYHGRNAIDDLNSGTKYVASVFLKKGDGANAPDWVKLQCEFNDDPAVAVITTQHHKWPCSFEANCKHK